MIMLFDGFEFVKVADFFTAAPCEYKRRKQDGEWTAALELVTDVVRQAERNCYIIVVDGQPRYAGEYMYNMQDRMIKTVNGVDYFDHHKFNQVQDALAAGSKVELFIVADPYTMMGGRPRNAAKMIEQELIDHNSDELTWNVRGGAWKKYAGWVAKNCHRVTDLLKAA
ncbi:hypothetical protein [Vibrio sp. WXL210]|uniref:hypothetical protein n=1 Tax=Vibrio sp. WXL210 TaxID=3450709 RepID=UPI003EC82F3B